MFGLAFIDIDEVSADLQNLKDMNKRLLSELQTANMYDEIRSHRSSGRNKLHYAMGAIQRNREEIRRLEKEIEKYRQSFSHVNTPLKYVLIISETLLALLESASYLQEGEEIQKG